jgi:hypothetical protein
MSLNFEPVNLHKQYKYLDYFDRCSQKASDCSFGNLWGWADEYGLCWAWSDNLVWIKQTVPEELFWAPVGLWEDVDWKRLFNEYFNMQTIFTRIPEILIQLWRDSLHDLITIEESRDHWDYLYSVTELIELKGKRFHKKKNLLNQFRKKYDFEYVSLESDMIDQAMGMQEDWCTWRDCESSEALSAENRAIPRILSNWRKLQGLTGGAILIDQEMVAYTIAESLAEDTLVIHFEKGNHEYKGVYQAINQMFLEHSENNFEYVNREQDLGDEGLRKAKLSYNPVNFIKKYRVIIK